MTYLRKLSFFVAISLILTPFTASAAPVEMGPTRYLVQTHKSFWKNTFGARHTFDNGFTADLSDWQLRVARLAGLKVIPVQKLSILPAGEAVSGRLSRPSIRPTPSEQVPWGLKTIYNDTFLVTPSGGASVSVAVLDTGVFRDHVDLKGRIADCKDFTLAKQPVVDGKCDDKNGHGTHVAGIIAADGGTDGRGIYGVAPETSVYAYKVCGNNGSCWSDDIAFALRMAADNGANIVNLSLGSNTESSLISDAVAYAVEKGVLVIAAAGNDGPYPDSIDYPAARANVVAVGAMDSALVISEWSSRGINSTTTSYVVEEHDIEFAAPGVNIESTSKDGGYVIFSGTSMAAPHVAGLAAKLWVFSAPNPAGAVRALLQNNARDLMSAGDDNDSGFGLPTI